MTNPPDTPTPRNLAERCFDYVAADNEVFDEVNRILGCNTEECLKDDFKWQCIHSWTDYYDGSVEVIRPAECQSMSREQADQILALGFSCIFESIGGRAYYWTKSSVGIGSPREGDRTPLVMAQKRLAAVTAERDALRKALREVWNTSVNDSLTFKDRVYLIQSCTALNPEGTK